MFGGNSTEGKPATSAARRMDAKSLKKLNRRELLELLVQISEQNEDLKKQNDALKAQLADRALKGQQIGSIAKAALEANGFFHAAEEAARQYLENIARLSQATEAESKSMIEEYESMIAHEASTEAKPDAQEQEAGNLSEPEA